jgi:hypothetical protein
MSTENDVPLGEGSRRYYEQQFGSRIHQINKGCRAPQRDSGGSGWGGGRAGCGAVFVVIFVLRLIFLFLNTHSNKPSNDFALPQHHFDFGEQQRLPDFPGQDKDKDKDELKRLEDILRRMKQPDPDAGKPNDDIPVGGPGQKPPNNEPEAGKANDDNSPGPERLLTQADVPLLEGLCYRIYHEGRQPGASPGKPLGSGSSRRPTASCSATTSGASCSWRSMSCSTMRPCMMVPPSTTFPARS